MNKNRLKYLVLSCMMLFFGTTGFIMITPAQADCAACICAERINWLGQCRGETTRLCKGSTGCTSCGGDQVVRE